MTLPTTHNALLTLLFTATGALLKGLKCSTLIKQCSFTKRSSLKSQRSIWRSLYASPWLADPIWYWSTTKFSTKYFFPPNVCSTLPKPDWSIPYFLFYQRHLKSGTQWVSQVSFPITNKLHTAHLKGTEISELQKNNPLHFPERKWWSVTEISLSP